MGLCASSTSTDVAYADNNADPQTYEAKMERLEKEQAKNFLSVSSFPVVKELGCGIAEVYEEDGEVESQDMTEELDGMFTIVQVKGQAKDRHLRMRTFLRKYLLSNGKDRAAIRVAPFVDSIQKMAAVKTNQYLLSLEHAFFNRTDCVLVMSNYVTDLEMMLRHGFSPTTSEATGIVCSVVLALQHLHQSKLTAGDKITASNVLVSSEGRSHLSLLPIAATRIGCKRKETLHSADSDGSNNSGGGSSSSSSSSSTVGGKSKEGGAAAASAKQTSGGTAEGGSSSNNSSQEKESPGAKYRIQTKQSEVRGDANESAKAFRNKIRRDYLLLGRLAALVFGVRKGTEESSKDSELMESASSQLKDLPSQKLVLGLLNPDQEERWNYESIKRNYPDYEWERLEDVKEELYPPQSVSKLSLTELNEKIMEEAKKKEEGEDLIEVTPGAADVAPAVASAEAEDMSGEEEKTIEKQEEEDDEPEFLDHGDDDEDIESEYGDDELLPWEAQEVLAGWDHNSTVLSVHQLSNHIQSNKLADFASYDATYYKPIPSGEQPSISKLRPELQAMGEVMAKEIVKSDT